MIKQNIVCENGKAKCLRHICSSTRRVVKRNLSLLGNKIKYDMYTSAGECNQQECKVYPQVKYYEYKISYHEF
jgi:hypothetical protein